MRLEPPDPGKGGRPVLRLLRGAGCQRDYGLDRASHGARSPRRSLTRYLWSSVSGLRPAFPIAESDADRWNELAVPMRHHWAEHDVGMSPHIREFFKDSAARLSQFVDELVEAHHNLLFTVTPSIRPS